MQTSQQVEEEKKAVKAKHFNLKEDKEGGLEEVELIQNKHIRNTASPFINQTKSWDDETLNIPDDLKRNIIEVLGFQKPSRIQATAIPLIIGEDSGFEHLIAQGKNGSGKTGAFSIGSTLRIDRKILKPQVLVLAHVRELSQQIADVYAELTKNTDIMVSNFTATGKCQGCHIVVSTIGKILHDLKGRKPQLDLSALKCIVIDEADFFFQKKEEIDAIHMIDEKHIKKLPQKVQYILFSATYPDEVSQAISTLIDKAQQINIRKELLQLDHIQQFQYRCDKGKKVDFVKNIFEVCSMTQTIIFVNSKKFAEVVFDQLRKASLQVVIIFGNMDHEERDEMIDKFRKGKIAVIITTNMLARGIDVPEVQIVINFDVPLMSDAKGQVCGDPENYLHRIGRTGRFGTKGLAITIYDREVDETYLNQILDEYKMRDKCKLLEGPEKVAELLSGIRDI